MKARAAEMKLLGGGLQFWAQRMELCCPSRKLLLRKAESGPEHDGTRR